jgi:hypothetical protein
MDIKTTKATSPPMIGDMVFGGMILASKERVRVSLSLGDNSMKIWSSLKRFSLIKTSFVEQAQKLLRSFNHVFCAHPLEDFVSDSRCWCFDTGLEFG